jgi:hypothetical protein
MRKRFQMGCLRTAKRAFMVGISTLEARTIGEGGTMMNGDHLKLLWGR